MPLPLQCLLADSPWQAAVFGDTSGEVLAFEVVCFLEAVEQRNFAVSQEEYVVADERMGNFAVSQEEYVVADERMVNFAVSREGLYLVHRPWRLTHCQISSLSWSSISSFSCVLGWLMYPPLPHHFLLVAKLIWGCGQLWEV